VTIIEPGFVETELLSHNEGNPFVMQAGQKVKDEIGEVLKAEDIADAIVHSLAAPPHVSINEVLVRPTKQRT
jgi:NADP-dependent 3-hydroxy acid dehydrogenase YdfG